MIASLGSLIPVISKVLLNELLDIDIQYLSFVSTYNKLISLLSIDDDGYSSYQFIFSKIITDLHFVNDL